ncbi:hypothetical protein LPJ61_007119, partial [Coemansia biformis]
NSSPHGNRRGQWTCHSTSQGCQSPSTTTTYQRTGGRQRKRWGCSRSSFQRLPTSQRMTWRICCGSRT